MKKLVIWFLSATILAAVIAAGFFYYQSTNVSSIQNIATTNNQQSNNSNQTNIPVSSEQPETLSINQLPADIQLKDNIIEYPIKMKFLSDKAILRVTNSQIINHANIDDTIFQKLEIIDNDHIFLITEHKENDLMYSKHDNKYFFPDNPLSYSGYVIIQSNDINYLAYSLDDAAMPAPFIYKLVQVSKQNNQLIITPIDGIIITTTSPPGATSPIQMEENKYISTPMLNSFFGIKAYYEIVGNKVQFADKEFPITSTNAENGEYKLNYQREQLKQSKSITLYEKPNTQSHSINLDISENTQAKFIGIKYITPEPNDMADFLIHVIINDKQEGWIKRDDLGKFGIYPLF